MMPRLGPPIWLEDVAAGARFVTSLPWFLRSAMSIEQARSILRCRLERRGADFLALARSGIYSNAASPYRQLLQRVGCEYGDLERMVRQGGIEEALGSLHRGGVYLSVDEFKGRRPVVRGSTSLQVHPAGLRNPRSAAHVWARTSGSRGTTTVVPIDLAFIRDTAADLLLDLAARGGAHWQHAIWGVPGGTAMGNLLTFSLFGSRPLRWFSQVDPVTVGLHPRYRWSARAMRWVSLLLRAQLPMPQYVPLQNPAPVANWMMRVLAGGGTPHLYTFASTAVRLCQFALEAGLDIRGARLTVTGEPVTATRLAAIRRAGATAVPRYGSVESGPIGYGCLIPEAPDEVHLFHDLVALIQPKPDGAVSDVPAYSLLTSSIRPTVPLILLNVSLGDRAVIGRRACGCPLTELGWNTHLHTIRSYEKLTTGGMAFLDTDAIRVLEEVLPAHFGGGPGDYQLVEEEADDGRARLRLLVHPNVGPVNAAAVADVFLASIGGGSGSELVMASQWRGAGLLLVERREPRATGSGKILHLHQERSDRAAGSSSNVEVKSNE
jgi:hypothetical protein